MFDPCTLPDAPPPAIVTTLCKTAELCTQKPADEAPTVRVIVRMGHAVQVDAADAPSTVEYVKAAQGVHVALDVAPVAAEYVPAGHAVLFSTVGQ